VKRPVAVPVLRFVDHELLARAQTLAQIGAALGEKLPPFLRNHFWVTGIVRDELRLATDSPHFVPALRFHHAVLLERANPFVSSAGLGGVKRLRVSLTSAHAPAPRARPIKVTVTSETVSQLAAASAAIGDGQLRDAMLILARRLSSLIIPDPDR
jgi:hypothetical protein